MENFSTDIILDEQETESHDVYQIRFVENDWLCVHEFDYDREESNGQLKKITQEELEDILEHHCDFMRDYVHICNCDMSYLDFSNRNLCGLMMVNCDCTGANFSNCDLYDAAFYKSNLTNIIADGVKNFERVTISHGTVCNFQ